jgi:hypothetical protein
MPTIDLTDDEHAAVTAAIKRAIERSGVVTLSGIARAPARWSRPHAVG